MYYNVLWLCPSFCSHSIISLPNWFMNKVVMAAVIQIIHWSRIWDLYLPEQNLLQILLSVSMTRAERNTQPLFWHHFLQLAASSTGGRGNSLYSLDKVFTLDMDFSSLSAVLLLKELSIDLQIAMFTMLVLHTELFLIY